MKFLQGFWKLFKKPSPAILRKSNAEPSAPAKAGAIDKGADLHFTSISEADSIKSNREFKDTKFKPSPASFELEKQQSSKTDPREKDYPLVQKPGETPPSYGPIIRPKRDTAYLQVGIDFGTSSTKIVYSQLGRAVAHAICFDHKLPHYPDYCVPSVAAVGKSGKLLLGIEAARMLVNERWDKGFQRFKVIVAGNCDEQFMDKVTCSTFVSYRDSCKGLDGNFVAERLTAIYLAYIINLTRNHIKNLPEYRNMDVDVTFNICMPIDHIENDLVRKQFENIFNWAEAIELNWQEKGDSLDILKASYECEGTTPKPTSRVFAVPEAVAEVASYFSSLLRQEGLHAVVDFGAGTTDVSIFRLAGTAGEMVSYWYAARNIPRGTANVERIVAEHLAATDGERGCSYRDVVRKISRINEDKSLSESINREVYDLWKSDEYKRTWAAAYNHLKKQTKWEKVQVFTCGGGAGLPHIKDTFSIPWWDNLHVKYPVVDLPKPDNYDPGQSNAPFSRMAVAYGLSIPKPKLDRYKLPKEVDDQTPDDPPVRVLDHEEMYAR